MARGMRSPEGSLGKLMPKDPRFESVGREGGYYSGGRLWRLAR